MISRKTDDISSESMRNIVDEEYDYKDKSVIK